MMIQLEIWSDIACPYCYIGKRHLEAALETFPHRQDVEIRWRSFELDPEAPIAPTGSAYENLARKYGRPLEWARDMCAQMKERGDALGLKLDFDRLRNTNTFDAHRLIHLAAKHGQPDAAEEHLFRAYFEEGKLVSDPDVLREIGREIGIPPAETENLVLGPDFTTEVREDEEAAAALGITGVPFFVLNGRYAISGAQPVEVFERALRTAWENRPKEKGMETNP